MRRAPDILAFLERVEYATQLLSLGKWDERNNQRSFYECEKTQRISIAFDIHLKIGFFFFLNGPRDVIISDG